MLEVCQLCVHRIAGAHPAQAAQWEVVVQYQRLLRVVEALDVLARLGGVGTAVDVLQHVQVGGDVPEAVQLVLLQHLVHEVDIAKVPTGASLVLGLERRRHHRLHHLGPAGMTERQDHLVNVQQCDVLVPAMNAYLNCIIIVYFTDLVNICVFGGAHQISLQLYHIMNLNP